MGTLTFCFYRNTTLLAKIIKYITFGRFNHVGIRFEVGSKVKFIESMGGSLKIFWGVGAYRSEYTNHPYALTDSQKIERIVFNVPTVVLNQILEHTETRVGARYGILDFLRFGIRFLPRGKGYTCGELATEVYEMMTGQSVRNSVSPQMLYYIIQAYKLGSNERHTN
jgi:hypothetical protein